MTLEELIALYRADAFDQHEPYLCGDELLTLYANEAQDEACRRGQLLRDSISPICRIAYEAGAEHIPLDGMIINILRARADGHAMCLVSLGDMDRLMPSWQDDQQQGRPTHLVSGLSTGVLFLWPRPVADGTVVLTVQRLSLKRLANDTDKLEIRPELHTALVNWILFRAYSRQDSELHDAQKAALSLQRFEAEFGRKASGRNEQWVRNGLGFMPGPIA